MDRPPQFFSFLQRPLIRYTLKRILLAIPVLFSIIIISFVLSHIIPGDPIYMIIGEGSADPVYLEMMRERYGLNRPLHEQLVTYVSRALRGDLGISIQWQRPVFDVIIERADATLLLFLSVLLYATPLGIIIGVISANKPYTIRDNLITLISLLGYSVPVFWLGQILLLVFGLYLNIFPIGGMTSIQVTEGNNIPDLLMHLILPTITWGSGHLALIARLTRASMLESLSQDYIITAQSKGLKDRIVLYKHALRNALLPVVTYVGMRIGYLFSGSILVETVFAWPGLGRLLFGSLLTRDYPMIIGMLIMVSFMVTGATIIVDIIYAILDPRIRYR